ncbi:MAG: hypothetical protein P3T54_04295 [Dehalogenimonas sp.]|nr:hypothetical protein [Dehalogenimonas sp.]
MELARFFDGRKFMWDGETYDSETEYRPHLEKYSAEGFEVKELNENEKYYLFTRRVVAGS